MDELSGEEARGLLSDREQGRKLELRNGIGGPFIQHLIFGPLPY